MLTSTHLHTFKHCLHCVNKCVHIVYEKENLKRRKISARDKKSVYTIVNRGVEKKRALENSALKKERGEKRGEGKKTCIRKMCTRKKGGEVIHTKD